MPLTNSSRRKPSFVTLADRARDSGQWEMAAQYYQKSLARNPSRSEIWVQYGHVLKEYGKLSHAESAYRLAITCNPDCADAYLHLGHLLKTQARNSDAQAAYLRAFVIDPGETDSVRELRGFGWTETRLTEVRAALKPEEKARKPERRPFSISGLKRRRPSVITLADRARDTGQWELAAHFYRKALERNPNNPPIWVQYGHALKEAGHLVQAGTAYRTAVAYDSQSADAYLHLGQNLKLQGRSDEARACYLRAFALDGASPCAIDGFCELGWSKAHVIELRRLARLDVTAPTEPRSETNIDESPKADIPKPNELGVKRHRIQVYRRSSLGDVLLITPVLKALRNKHPDDEIIVSTELPEVIHYNPHIDGIVESRSPLPDFDETFVLEYETRPEEHIVDAYARIAEVAVPDRTPEIYLHHEERIAASKLLRDAGVDLTGRYCVMQVTSQWRVRDWPIERFKEVAEALQEAGLGTVVLGHERRPRIDFGIDLRGKTTVRIAAAIIEKCALMVTIDSGLMHVGYALRRPVIALFGCTDPEKRAPDWALPHALYSDIVCRGCHHRQRPTPVVTPPECPWETVRCMERLSAQKVINMARRELDRMDKPVVSVVIPHYFRSDMLNGCLSSIFRFGASRSFEVVVVANGSPEESLQNLEAWLPNFRIVRLEPNQGFSKACNAGARSARGTYLIFLNDDTTVTAGWLDEMISFIESNPEIGIVGPKLLFPGNDTIQHSGTVINERGMGEHIYGNLPGSFARANRPRFYRALTGACLLIKKEFFLLLGGFETEYHGTGGCEDTDLCFKVLSSGKMVAYCPSSVVYHHEGVTRGRRHEEHPEELNNRALLRQRWDKYLISDISDYYLLGEIEAKEGKTWRWLREVPAEVIARYDSASLRRVGPYRVQVGSGLHPEGGYLHLDQSSAAPSVDIVHDLAKPLPFLDGSLSEILADQVIEKLGWQTLPKLIQEFYRVLGPGGQLVIRTSDLRHIAECYLRETDASLAAGGGTANNVEGTMAMATIRANTQLFGAQNSPTDLRLSCVDKERLSALCTEAGFVGVWPDEATVSKIPGKIEMVAIR